jgi:hypothetical protein
MLVTLTEKLEQFKRALAHPDFSHVSYRHWCGQLIYWVYFRDINSPSGVKFSGTAINECSEASTIMRELDKPLYRGGQRGNASLIGYLIDE